MKCRVCLCDIGLALTRIHLSSLPSGLLGFDVAALGGRAGAVHHPHDLDPDRSPNGSDVLTRDLGWFRHLLPRSGPVRSAGPAAGLVYAAGSQIE